MTLEELSAIAKGMPAGHRFVVPRVTVKDLWPDPVWRKPSDVDDHLTVAQRAEQWAHRHGVVVWQQYDPVGVMIEKPTPSGRRPSEPEMQELRPRISNVEMDIGKKENVDFSHLEMRVLADAIWRDKIAKLTAEGKLPPLPVERK